MEPLFSREELRRLEDEYPEGLSAAAIVALLKARGVVLAEATFRKYVQLGLLPPSRRVGRKGKHKGSHGLYPPGIVGRLAEIRALMDAGLTLEELRRSHMKFTPGIDGLGRGVDALLAGLAAELEARGAASGASTARLKKLKLQGDALCETLTAAVHELLPATPAPAPERDVAQLARDFEEARSKRHPARTSAAKTSQNRRPGGAKATSRRGAHS